MSFAIRPERPEDAAGIDALLRAAFPGAAEADLVRRLRADGDLALSLVAAESGTTIGQVQHSKNCRSVAEMNRVRAA